MTEPTEDIVNGKAKRKRTVNPEMSQVFTDEAEFQNAPESVRKKQSPFLVTYGQTGVSYYVWAPTMNMAVGYVARYLKLFACVTYNKTKQMSKYTPDDIVTILSNLPQDVREKVREEFSAIRCPQCGHKCQSRGGLALHLKTHEHEKVSNESGNGG